MRIGTRGNARGNARGIHDNALSIARTAISVAQSEMSFTYKAMTHHVHGVIYAACMYRDCSRHATTYHAT
jgi:hypothetical protein